MEMWGVPVVDTDTEDLNIFFESNNKSQDKDNSTE